MFKGTAVSIPPSLTLLFNISIGNSCFFARGQVEGYMLGLCLSPWFKGSSDGLKQLAKKKSFTCFLSICGSSGQEN